MFKTLLKKELLQFFSAFFVNRKNGKGRSGKSTAAYIVLYIFLFVMLGSVFFNTANTMCAALAAQGMSALYFVIMSLIGMALGIFGSVFNTYAGLFKARDNELLLSLPIPPRMILSARMTGVWVMGTVYQAIVMIPTLIAYYIRVPQTVLSVAFSILTVLLLSVIVLALSCALGWVVALISTKLKNKSIVTVFASLLLIAIYYYVYMKAYELIGLVVQNAEKVSSFIRTYIFLFWQMGLAAEGEVVPMLFFTAFTAVVFAAVVFAMSRTFIRITTLSGAVEKGKYKEKDTKKRSVGSALLKREFNRFFSSPTYMLNCSIGTIMMPAAGIVMLFRGNWLLTNLSQSIENIEEMIPLLGAATVCMLVSMNDITAPSVSLEGKSLWILQSLPLEMNKVLRAKLLMHLIMTLLPACFAAVCIGVSMDFSALNIVLVTLTAMLFCLFNGAFGLAVNLRMPNLTWTSEVAPIKQGASSAIAIFGSWGVVIVFGVLYLLLGKLVPATVFLGICAGIVAVAAACLTAYVDKKGAKILKNL